MPKINESLRSVIFMIVFIITAPPASGSASSPKGLQAGFLLVEHTARREGRAYSSERGVP
jgi:hypothetical protein